MGGHRLRILQASESAEINGHGQGGRKIRRVEVRRCGKPKGRLRCIVLS